MRTEVEWEGANQGGVGGREPRLLSFDEQVQNRGGVGEREPRLLSFGGDYADRARRALRLLSFR